MKILFALLLLLPGVSLAATFCADPVNGSSGNSGAYPGACKATPQQAQDAASSGDTICLMPGLNQGRVVMDTQGQTLTRCEGVARGQVTLGIQTTAGDSTEDIRVTAANVTIDGTDPTSFTYFSAKRWMEVEPGASGITIKNLFYDSGKIGRVPYSEIAIFGTLQWRAGDSGSTAWHGVPLIRIKSDDAVVTLNSLTGVTGNIIALSDNAQRAHVHDNVFDGAQHHVVNIDGSCEGQAWFHAGHVFERNYNLRSHESDGWQANGDGANPNPPGPNPNKPFPCKGGMVIADNFSGMHGENSADPKEQAYWYLMRNYFVSGGGDGTAGLGVSRTDQSEGSFKLGDDDYDNGCGAMVNGAFSVGIMTRNNIFWSGGDSHSQVVGTGSSYANTLANMGYASNVGADNPNCADEPIAGRGEYGGFSVFANNIVLHQDGQVIGRKANASNTGGCFAGNVYSNAAGADWEYDDFGTVDRYSTFAPYQSRMSLEGTTCPETGSESMDTSTLVENQFAVTGTMPWASWEDPWATEDPSNLFSTRVLMDLSTGREASGQNFLFLPQNETSATEINIGKDQASSICCVGTPSDWPSTWDGFDSVQVNGVTRRVIEVKDSTGTADGKNEVDTIVVDGPLTGVSGDPIIVINSLGTPISTQQGSYGAWVGFPDILDPGAPTDPPAPVPEQSVSATSDAWEETDQVVYGRNPTEVGRGTIGVGGPGIPQDYPDAVAVSGDDCVGLGSQDQGSADHSCSNSANILYRAWTWQAYRGLGIPSGSTINSVELFYTSQVSAAAVRTVIAYVQDGCLAAQPQGHDGISNLPRLPGQFTFDTPNAAQDGVEYSMLNINGLVPILQAAVDQLCWDETASLGIIPSYGGSNFRNFDAWDASAGITAPRIIINATPPGTGPPSGYDNSWISWWYFPGILFGPDSTFTSVVTKVNAGNVDPTTAQWTLWGEATVDPGPKVDGPGGNLSARPRTISRAICTVVPEFSPGLDYTLDCSGGDGINAVWDEITDLSGWISGSNAALIAEGTGLRDVQSMNVDLSTYVTSDLSFAPLEDSDMAQQEDDTQAIDEDVSGIGIKKETPP